MNCREINDLLAGYVLGDLAPEHETAVRGHLAVCADCRQAEAALRRDLAVVSGAMAQRGGESLRLDAAHRAAIRAALRERPAVTRLPFRRVLEWAAAAMILVMLAGLLMPAMSTSRGRAMYMSSVAAARSKEVMNCMEVAVQEESSDRPRDMTPSQERLGETPRPAETKGSVEDAERSRTYYGGAGLAELGRVQPEGGAKAQVAAGDDTYTIVSGRAERELNAAAGGAGPDSGVINTISAPPAKPARPAPEYDLRNKDDNRAGVGGATYGYSVQASSRDVSGEPAAVPDEAKPQSRFAFGGKALAQNGDPFRSEEEKQELTVEVAKSPLTMKGLYAAGKSSASGSSKRRSVVRHGGAATFEKSKKSEAPDSSIKPKERDSDGVVDNGETVQAPADPASAAVVDRLQAMPTAQPQPGQSQAQNRSLQVAWADGIHGEAAARDLKKGKLKEDVEIRKEGAESRAAGPQPITEESGTPEPQYPPQVYHPIVETKQNVFSTFGLDVDTASFTLARRSLLGGRLPPVGAIRVEEFVNAFEYAYPAPATAAFAIYCDRARSPFRPGCDVLRIGVRGKVLGRDRQRPAILTLVVDTSGSMNTADRLELAQKALSMMVERLSPSDRVAIVAFGSEPRLVLDHTPASAKDAILKAIAGLQTYGSTHLEGGIRLGYEVAARHFKSTSVNRVLIFSDGVANLGAATPKEILDQAESCRKQGIYCSVFGLGSGTYNDAMLQALADKGDGVYRFLDTLEEAKRVLVDEMAATLHVIAKDAKIQVEFDPARVKTYRQIGYEKRRLEKEQFRDDTVDAGEVGSGQSATALYEVETTGGSDEPLGVVRMRWKDPESGLVTEIAQPIPGIEQFPAFECAPARFRLAAGAAELADWLRGNPLSAGTESADILKVLRSAALELNLDAQVQDTVRMASEAARLRK